MRSPWSSKIVADFHWLEMELSSLLIQIELRDALSTQVSTRWLAAMQFAAMIVEVHRRLSKSGQNAIEGCLRDGLNSEFPAIYLEMEIAQLLMLEGFDVSFPDLEGHGRVDLHYENERIEGEVECKSLSVDAGRKIHRRDFYRFIDDVAGILTSRVEAAAQELLVISVSDRFPDDKDSRRALVNAAQKVLSESNSHAESCDWYSVERRSLDVLGKHPVNATGDIYTSCRKTFGEQCHVAGPMTDRAVCLVVATSQKQDDTTKPMLEAMKKAFEQLSPRQPGFIAVQFNDIEAQALALPHLRERSMAACRYLFGTRDSEKLAAVYFCAYAAIQIIDGGIGTPAYVCWNPRLSISPDGLPFRTSISDDDFARVLGLDRSSRH